MHQPSKIPAELWQVFRQVDGIKKTITNSNKGDIKAELQGNDASTYVHTNIYACTCVHNCTCVKW